MFEAFRYIRHHVATGRSWRVERGFLSRADFHHHLARWSGSLWRYEPDCVQPVGWTRDTITTNELGEILL